MPKRRNPDGNLRTYPEKELVEAVALATMQGRGLGLRTNKLLAPVSEDDRRVLQRVVGLTVEEFNQKLIGKLDRLADLILDRMTETVDKTPLQSLGFNLAVAIDKRQRLAGQAASGNANVNIQVNNYGQLSKEELIAKLSGRMEVPIAAAAEPPVELPGGQEAVGVDVGTPKEAEKALRREVAG